MNVENNVEKIPDKNPIPGNKKFGIDQPQPSPEAKKQGWANRKDLMYWINEYSKMDVENFIKIVENFEKNPSKSKLVANQVIALNYVKKAMEADHRFVVDRLDRKYGKAAQTIKNEGGLNINITKNVIKTDSGDQD